MGYDVLYSRMDFFIVDIETPEVTNYMKVTHDNHGRGDAKMAFYTANALLLLFSLCI